MIYLYCMVAMCEISLKHQKEAQEALLTKTARWESAFTTDAPTP